MTELEKLKHRAENAEHDAYGAYAKAKNARVRASIATESYIKALEAEATKLRKADD